MLSLAGCGGGSSSPTPSSSTTISGSAIKGPLANASISIYKTVDGAKGDLLQTVTSGPDGSYTATITGYSGVVLVEASATANTRMLDEATGTTITPTPGFTMRASFVAESGKTYSSQINPFTELATATALATDGGLSSTNVEKSNSDLAAALQFNPLTTVATFDSNNKPTNAAAVTLAAISEMALAGEQGCIGDQAAKVTCITTALSTNGLGDPIIQTALQTNIDAITTALKLPAQTITDPANPETPPPVADALAQAKAFISTLRSNAKALDATDLSLQTELQKVSDDLSGRTAPIAASNVNALNIATMGAQFWDDVIKNPDAPYVASKTFYKTSYVTTVGITDTDTTPATVTPYSEAIGGCTFYKDADYLNEAKAKDEAKYVACSTSQSNYEDYIPATDANGEYKQCMNLGDWCRTNWTTRIRLHPDSLSVNKFTVYTQTRATKYVVTSTNPFTTGEDRAARKSYGAAFPGNAATLTLQRDNTGEVIAVNLAGELAPAFNVEFNFSSYFDANQDRWVFKPNAVATVFGDKHNVALAGALSQVGTLKKLAISGSMELIKAGALETRIELAEGSYLQVTVDGNGDYSTADGSQEMLLKLKGGSTASSIAGELKLSDFKSDVSKESYIPTLMSFKGSVQRNGVSFFEGTITGEALNYSAFDSSKPISSNNTQTMRVGFEGSVIIPNRPVLKVTLSATETDSGSIAPTISNLTGQFVQGYNTINISGLGSATSDVVTLESTSGLKLVIDKSKQVYPLTKGSDVLGEFSQSTNRLTYSDNSYEQF
jgi:hypothetical protein